MTTPVVFGHLGPVRHGVRRYGHRLAAAVGGVGPVVEVDADGPGELLDELATVVQASRPEVVHLQYTDHLVRGGSYDAGWFTELRRRLPGVCIAVTIHDLPHVGHDDARLDHVRSPRYRDVADRTDLVIVAAEHERRALARTGHRRPVVAIPHPVEPVGTTRRPAADPNPPTVGILGYVYPGKGHALVIDACSRLPTPVRVDILGRASDGHDSLVDELVRHAHRLAVDLEVSGWIDDDRLNDRLGEVTVPVAPHPAPSASASIGTWWSAGRRPVVPDSPHARHLQGLHPAGVELVREGCVEAMADAIGAALRFPDTTLMTAAPVSLAPAAIGRRHVEAYRHAVASRSQP